MKVFISHCWKQKDWVVDYLLPVLDAAGIEALVDHRHFKAGLSLPRQMDGTQDQADMQLLLFSEDYIKSRNCLHEMVRALALDPDFSSGAIIPLKLGKVDLPDGVKAANPLYIAFDFEQGRAGDASAWDQLAMALGFDLGVSPHAWLSARDRIERALDRNDSVNLIAQGGAWRSLVDHVTVRQGLARIDLQDGRASTRSGLVGLILGAAGLEVPAGVSERNALVHLAGQMEALKGGSPSRQVWSHAQEMVVRADERANVYNRDLFGALRNLINDERRLVVLAVSSTELGPWMDERFQSPTDFKTVRL